MSAHESGLAEGVILVAKIWKGWKGGQGQLCFRRTADDTCVCVFVLHILSNTGMNVVYAYNGLMCVIYRQ